MAFFNRKKKKPPKDIQNGAGSPVMSSQIISPGGMDKTDLLSSEDFVSDSELETTLLSEERDPAVSNTKPGDRNRRSSFFIPKTDDLSGLASEDVNHASQSENPVSTDDDEEPEYEGQTSLLSESESPYFNQNGSDNDTGANPSRSETAKVTGGVYTGISGNPEAYGAGYDMRGDGTEGTTVLSEMQNVTDRSVYIPEGAPKAFLIKIIKSQKTEITKVKFLIGSGDQGVDLRIDNTSVSRKHAYFLYDNGRYFLVDNKSTNKTLLDGKVLAPFEPVQLYHGALIQFADELFQFVCDRS